MEFMSRFNYTWQYKPGRTNVADPLSRNPAFSDAPLASTLPRLASLLAGAARGAVKRRKLDGPVNEQQVGNTLTQALEIMLVFRTSLISLARLR